MFYFWRTIVDLCIYNKADDLFATSPLSNRAFMKSIYINISLLIEDCRSIFYLQYFFLKTFCSQQKHIFLESL